MLLVYWTVWKVSYYKLYVILLVLLIFWKIRTQEEENEIREENLNII